MSNIAESLQVQFSRTCLIGTVLAGLGSACASDHDATRAVGSAGAAGTVAVDNWVPPPVIDGTCSIAADAASPTNTDFLKLIGCRADFDALASAPLTASIPGASSVKVVLDQSDSDALYFQNSKLYKIHWDFASKFLSFANGYSDVGTLSEFNTKQYSAADRRFLLGAVTYYDGPKYWAYEVAPYDTATAAMIEKTFRAVKQAGFFGDALVFHPTSNAVEATAKGLPKDIHVKTTDQIFAGIDYQPLNLGETVGRLHFVKAADLTTDFVDFRDIVVLDAVPVDISVVSGMITEQFQTPLSHVNVLALNRGTPNMGLRGATTNPDLVGLKDQWVRLKVGSENYSVTPATQAEADAWWADHAPPAITLPPINMSVTDLIDVEKVTDEANATSLKDAIHTATLAYGAKTANYSVLYNTPGVPIRKAFAIPAYYYVQFMQENGLFDQYKAMAAESGFQNDLSVRSQRLTDLRKAIEGAPINQAFQDLLKAKIAESLPGQTLRFRTSTNAEDLDGFPCAGCYNSHSGDPSQWSTVLDAIRLGWEGVFYYRTYQEREYHRIDHMAVGMGLLVHHNFPAESANGVAVTANIYVPSGLDPAFYINVQNGGDYEVVNPKPGITSDEFLYYFYASGHDMTFVGHSNVIPAGTTVLTARQTYDLGKVLDIIQTRFSNAYGPGAGNYGWYAMDVEFKFDNEMDTSQPPSVVVKQARPYPAPATVTGL
jgi:pyruvate, water dikinase